MDQLLNNYFIEFQSLENIEDKIDFLNKNADDLNKDFDINIPNLISAWKRKLVLLKGIKSFQK